MNHQFYTEEEARAQGGIENALYRNVSEGGLAERVVADQQDRIYNREVDFVDGQKVALGTSATWNAFANSGMRYMEESDISGGATD